MSEQPPDDESLEERTLVSALTPERAFGNYQATQVELSENRAKLTAAQSALQSLRERFSDIERRAEDLESQNKSLSRLNDSLASRLLSTESKEQEQAALIDFLKQEGARLVKEKDDQLAHFQSLIGEKDQALASIITSSSFRIGKKLTSIAKRLLSLKSRLIR